MKWPASQHQSLHLFFLYFDQFCLEGLTTFIFDAESRETKTVFIVFTISISIVIGFPIGYSLQDEEFGVEDETRVYACIVMVSFMTYANIFVIYLNVKKKKDDLSFGNTYFSVSIAQILAALVLYLVAHEEYSIIIWALLLILNIQFIVLIVEFISIMNGKHQLNIKDQWIGALLLLIEITILSIILYIYFVLLIVVSLFCFNSDR